MEDSSPANGPGDDALRPGFLRASSAAAVNAVLLSGMLEVSLACEPRRDVDHLLLLSFTGLLEPW